MSKVYGPPRTDFGPPPPGYKPGIGRGALAFTTRSDVGPAALKGGPVVPERGQGPAELQRIKEAKEKERDEDLSESVYDEFSGYGGSLFKGGEYDQEDKDADLLYQAIDERMESRHSKRRKERTKQEQEALAKAGPTVQDQFKMLKEELKTVSSKEWESLPEAMDLSGRNKQINAARQAALTTHASLSDQLLLAAAAGGQQLVGTIDVKSSSASASTSDGNGYATPVGLGGMVDLTQLGKARDKALGIKLDRAADSTTISSGTATVDAKGYLTDLSSMKSGNGVGDVSDIKKMRMLFKSVISSNPGNAPGWIGAARLERDVGKMSAARELIARGCAACPTNEDIWIEAAALNPTEARAILGKAVQHIPTSVNIWLHAANVEETLEGKRTVIRRALEVLPRSISLWKAAVQLEQPKEARVLLSRAVELIPTALDFWLALAKLETAENARAVLNKARLSIPTEPLIWVAAAQLEEANGNTSRLVMLMQNALTSLAAHKVVMSRESWLQEAIKCETAGSVATCHAIVCVCLGLGIDELDRRNTWMNDAERFTHEGNYETARAVLEQVVSSFPDDEAAWLQAAHLERNHGTPESLANLLAEGCRKCPHSETLWLMTAKAKWVGGDVDGARDVLRDAFSANPNSEEIWLAASKLEFENQEYERSTALLAKARTRASTARVWLKSAKMARVLGHADEEMKLLLEGLERFPAAHKLWIMLAQHHEKAGNVTAARDTYRKGVRACPGAVDLWLCFAAFEGKSGAAADLSRARSVLESARAAIPKNAQIWLASCKIELRANNASAAHKLIATALQECPNSGLLWSFRIEIEPRQQRKGLTVEALKKCPEDARVFLTCAKMLWDERKLEKAREWFNRAVATDADLGDIWVYFYKFESEMGGEKAAQRVAEVIARCSKAEPRHGELWCSVSKMDHKLTPKTSDILAMCASKITDLFYKP